MSTDKKFTGTVGRTIFDTKYRYNTTPAQEKKPNVIYILMDDMGFAQLGCYGSSINTPNIDKLAKDGLRYNNFHTTAVCSATRASLLTGANHHTAGIAGLCEMQTGCENAVGHIKPEYATIAEILKEYGYATFCSGKWHLAAQQATTGKKDDWPLAKGFDNYYGFLQGENDQFHPHLIRDNSAVKQPKTVEEGYHFSEDIVDDAIHHIFTQQMNAPEQPFFLYLAFGAMHTPHHAPKEYIEKYKGKFDEGWDIVRLQWFERQKEIGIIPQEAELTEKNPYVKDWDSLNYKEKAVYARYMEAFAGMLEHTDAQIGRLIGYLREAGILDDTVIVFLSDNGASAEGGVDGRFNAMRGQDVTISSEGEVDYAYEHLDQIGTEITFNHYPTGWANCGNTPFKWYKIWAHEGGIKDPLIISYPKLIKDKGSVRHQYHHVSDITPTILDIIGEKKPESIKGVHQQPFTGISMKYTFDNAEASDEKTIQYYEVMGNRGIYKDGWKAVVNHTFTEKYEDDAWELYHVEDDYSEKYNIADKYPNKLRELQEDFMHEAGKYGVFPMLRGAFHACPENMSRMYGDGMKLQGKTLEFQNIIEPFDLVRERNIDSVNVNYLILAEIERESEEQSGVIYSNGQRFGGIALYVKDNRLKFAYNDNVDVKILTSDLTIPIGKISVGISFIRKKDHAIATLYVNKKNVGELKITRFSYMTGFAATVGANHYTAVAPQEYQVPFNWQGKFNSLKIQQFSTFIDEQGELERLLSVE